MFTKRFVSAVVMVAVLLAAIVLGDGVVYAFALLVAELDLWELLRATGITDKEKGLSPFIYCEMVVLALMYAGMYFLPFQYPLILAIVILPVFLLSFYVFKFNKFALRDIAIMITAYIYIGVMISFIPHIRVQMEYGIYLVWFILIPPMASDIFAYCIGILFGKHKFAPVVSPKKSIEGSVAGVIGSGLCLLLFALFMSKSIPVKSGFLPACFVIGCVCGGISQIGDLVASAIKREYSIKDYGNIIPGHGGALDRTDSIIYIAPIIYFCIMLLERYFISM